VQKYKNLQAIIENKIQYIQEEETSGIVRPAAFATAIIFSAYGTPQSTSVSQTKAK
jgi:hypothetical protein